jgi:hypothetical protein
VLLAWNYNQADALDNSFALPELYGVVDQGRLTRELVVRNPEGSAQLDSNNRARKGAAPAHHLVASSSAVTECGQSLRL